MDPKDIAPVANLFTISDAGSTSSMFIDLLFDTNLKRPLKFFNFIEWSLIFLEYFLKVL